VSLEANPEDWSPELATALVAAGVNRVSLGVQSLSRTVLDTLGRAHRAETALQAIATARQAGVRSIGIDLIFGAVGETEGSWAETVTAALEAQPDHISIYALTVERGTALSRAVRAGEVNPPDFDFQADAYEHFVDAATASGFTRYEVSNFAKPGHTVRYNLATWAQGDYVAFGLGAHGHREGVRRRNVRRLEAYLRMVESGRRPQAGADTISDWPAEQERVMLGLRRAAGVKAGDAGGCLWSSTTGARLRSAGVVRMQGDRLVVTRPLLTDDVARNVLSLSPGDC
jgi:oxygen-independent coproporphyrinogen-3 oxidase